MGLKTCSSKLCTQINPQPLSNFAKNKKGRNGLYCHCKTCHNIAGRLRHAGKEGRLRQWKSNIKKYWPSLTVHEAYREYMGLHGAQSGLCAICDKPELEMDEKNGTIKMLCVDHCHFTGKVRELLCARCNRGLGQFTEKASICQSAANYLNKHNNPCNLD